jgi:hypothetical protein
VKKRDSMSRRDAVKSVGVALSSLALPTLSSAEGQGSQLKIDYSLQKEIQGLNIPSTLTVVGIGRLGSWAALFAAVSGVDRLVLFDPSTVDAKDVATTPFKPSQVEMDKVEAIREIILASRPNAKVVTHKQLFVVDKDAQLLEGAVINGASDQELRRRLPDVARNKGLRYAAGGYKGLGVAVMDSFPTTSQIAPKDSPVWAGSAALSAVLTLYGVFVSPLNFAGSIHKLSLSRAQINAAFKALGNERP